jgi:hypothetical protein
MNRLVVYVYEWKPSFEQDKTQEKSEQCDLKL